MYCDDHISRQIRGDITDPYLGIGFEKYTTLAESIESVYHCAAYVSTIAAYPRTHTGLTYYHTQYFSTLVFVGPNVTGTRNMVDFACVHHTKEFFYISSISALRGETVCPLQFMEVTHSLEKYYAEREPITPENMDSMGGRDTHNTGT